jgi:hypothetical protein
MLSENQIENELNNGVDFLILEEGNTAYSICNFISEKGINKYGESIYLKY